MINKSITKSQSSFLQSGAPLTIFKGGIGAGKTLVLCLVAIIAALKGRTFLLVSFSYPTLRDVCLVTILECLRDMGFKNNIDYSLNRSEMTLKIKKGVVLLRSGDRPDRLRGINCHDAGIDEAREFKVGRGDQGIYDIIIGRMRRAEDGQLYISTTTKGKNWVWDGGILREQQAAKTYKQINTLVTQKQLDEQKLNLFNDFLNNL